MQAFPRIAAAMLLAFGVSGCISRPDASFHLAGNYWLLDTSAHQKRISPMTWDVDTPVIEPKVIEVAWDSRFILAKRQSLKFRGDFAGDTYQEPDPDKYDFGILDTIRPRVYGPLDEAEFAIERNALGVPEDLCLKDVNSCRRELD